MKNKFKAIMLDIDGTIVSDSFGFPSDRLCAAIVRAQARGATVSVVTGRPVHSFEYINKKLKISVPVVVEGGARIYHPVEQRDLWVLPIHEGDARAIIQELLDKSAPFSFLTGNNVFRSREYIALRAELKRKLPDVPESPWHQAGSIKEINTATVPEVEAGAISHFFIPTLPEGVDAYRNLLRKYSSIAFTANRSSTHKGWMGIYITHGEATKQHGVVELGKILGISPHEMIGVGDEEIDYPLLMACGLKVAMGNAVQSLKDIADYVAPTVGEDGVVDVIEKFLLTSKK